MNQIEHIRTEFNPFNRNRAIIFSVFAVALAVLSFHGALDNLVFSKLDELMKESLGLIVISRGVNAAVSVLQTIEFKIPFISSAQIGQVLDPINDASERLTVALMWAIGSLFLQEISLKIASGLVFKWGFLAIAVLMVATLLLAQSDRVRTAVVTTFGISHIGLAQFQGIFIRAFVVATIFRFIVPTFAVASILVSQALVAPEIRQHAVELERHEKGLSELGAQISEAHNKVINEQKSQAEILTDDETEDSVPEEEVERASPPPPDQAATTEDVQILGEQRVKLEKKLDSLQAEKKELTASINEKEDLGWTDRIWKFVDDPDKALVEADARIEQTEAEITLKEWKFACIEQRTIGERRTTGEKCESLLAEHRKQVLGELKVQLESQQTKRQEKLKSKLEERNSHIATFFDEAEGEEDSGWFGRVIEAPTEFFVGHSAEEIEAAKARVKDLDHEVAEYNALVERTASDLACINQRIAGEHCDSVDENTHVQPSLDRLKAQLKSELQLLRAELASFRDERERLAELENLKANRKQIERDIEKTTALVSQKDSELECAKRRVVGEDCDTFLEDVGQVISTTGTVTSEMVSRATDTASKGLSTAGRAAGRVVISVADATNRAFSKMSLGVLDRFKAIVDGAEDMMTRMVNILVLVVIENIVLPIIFLAIALKGSVPIARGVMRISTSIGEDTREALSALDQALPGRTD